MYERVWTAPVGYDKRDRKAMFAPHVPEIPSIEASPA